MSASFIKEAVERAVRTFVQAYLSVWVIGGADFDGLTNTDNLKAGAVAVALSVAMSMGLKNVGPNKNSTSIL
jgi:hypothetical protein